MTEQLPTLTPPQAFALSLLLKRHEKNRVFCARRNELTTIFTLMLANNNAVNIDIDIDIAQLELLSDREVLRVGCMHAA